MLKNQLNRVGATALLLLASSAANAYYLDVNLRWDTATYYRNDVMADGISIKCNSGAGDYACTDADRYTDNYVYIDVTSDLGTYYTQTGDTLTWGVGSGLGTSAFSFTGNDHDIVDSSQVIAPAFDDAHYAVNGYNPGDEIILGSVGYQNGQTSLPTTLAKVDIGIDVNIYDNAGGSLVFVRNFGINSTFDFNIYSTRNDAIPLSNIANHDELCSRAYAVDDFGTLIDERWSCALAEEEGLMETFNLTGLLGSLYLTGFTPTSAGSFVKDIYDDGRVVYTSVPEPAPVLLMLLGLSLMGFASTRRKFK